MTSRSSRRIIICLLATPCMVVACKKQTTTTSTGHLDTSIERHYALGWLGGQAHQATRAVSITGDKPQLTGGVVVTAVADGGPLAAGGVARGDVIVRVGETWLPNREDPFFEFVQAVEAEVSAGVEHIDLGVFRKGTVRTVKIDNDRVPFEVGLPSASQRLTSIADAGLERLTKLIADVPENVDDRTAVHSVAGLAFLAAGAAGDGASHAAALAQCHEQVEKAVSDHVADLDAWAAAWATLFLSELHGSPVAGATTFVADGGAMMMPSMPEGAFTMKGGLPEGAVVTHSFTIEGDGEDLLPEGLDLEELKKGGASIMVMGGPMEFGGAAPAVSANKEPMGDEPLWTLDELAPLAGDDIAERLATIRTAVERLIALQGENGGWDPADDRVGYSEQTVMTNHVLLALGTAQGAGVPVPGKVIKSALERLRATTNDGHVHSVPDAGFDRRLEAGRSSGAAAALLALNCEDNDAFLKELSTYSDDHAQGLITARGAVTLHVVNTAIHARQRGRAAWAMFFEEFRCLLSSLQNRDGSFASLPGEDPANPYVALVSTPAMRTALWSLVAALQQDHTPLLAVIDRHPLQRQITSDGMVVAAAPGPPAGMPQGEMMMDPDQARQMLEKMGIDLDEVLKNSIQVKDDDEE